jgi:hypothetical protein
MNDEAASQARFGNVSATLAYLVYGSAASYDEELAFSVQSARRAAGGAPLDVAIVTDRDRLAHPVDARLVRVSPAELAGWTHDGRYGHRAKLCALRRLLAEGSERVALVDTDTYFVGSPATLLARIAPGTPVMHAAEGPVGDDAAWRGVFDDPERAAHLAERGCSPHTPMFNSGVVGVCREHAHHVDAAIAFLDAYQGDVRAFNLEQVAWSVALAAAGDVAPADDLVVHYWGHRRPFVHVQIARALAGTALSLAALGFPRVALRDRLRSRAVAALRGWGNDARFSYHAALAARRSERARDGYAAAWAETSLVALERGRAVGALEPRAVPGLARALTEVGLRTRLAPELRPRWDALW